MSSQAIIYASLCYYNQYTVHAEQMRMKQKQQTRRDIRRRLECKFKCLFFLLCRAVSIYFAQLALCTLLLQYSLLLYMFSCNNLQIFHIGYSIICSVYQSSSMRCLDTCLEALSVQSCLEFFLLMEQVLTQNASWSIVGI